METADGAPSPGRGGTGFIADLAWCDLLSDTSPGDLQVLAGLLTSATAEPGTVLMRRGDVADRFLVLTGGTVRIRVGQGRWQKAFDVPEGSIVGEIALLRGTPQGATVTAVAEVRCLVGGCRRSRSCSLSPGSGTGW